MDNITEKNSAEIAEAKKKTEIFFSDNLIDLELKVEFVFPIKMEEKVILKLGKNYFQVYDMQSDGRAAPFPKERGGFEHFTNPFTITGNTLLIRSDCNYCFILSNEDIPVVRKAVSDYQQALEVIRPYRGSVLDTFTDKNIGEVRHPFVEANISDERQHKAFVDFLSGLKEMNKPLPWYTEDGWIVFSRKKFQVSFTYQLDHYSFLETKNSLEFERWTHQVGFFDTSEYEDSEITLIEFLGAQADTDVENISDETFDFSLLKKGDTVYFRNLFGINGIFRVSRTQKC